MGDAPLVNALVGLHCPHCNGGRWGNLESLRRDLDGSSFVCSGCRSRTPIERAYYLAIASMPLANVHFVSNYIWMRTGVDVPLGQLHTITLDTPLNNLHYVNANAMAEFPVHVGIVNRSLTGFPLIAAAAVENPSSRSVAVTWTAAGWRGPKRPAFLDAIGRALELLHQDPFRTPAMLRGALLEAAIAYEMFAAWYLRNFVWRDDYYAESKGKSAELDDIIRVRLFLVDVEVELYQSVDDDATPGWLGR